MKRILYLTVAMIPLMFFINAILFPVYVFLERDMQLNGKHADGKVVAYRKTYAKSGQAIHNCRVRFTADGKSYMAWVYCRNTVSPGDTVEIIYAPLFPRHARFAARFPDPWDQNLFVRMLAHLFIGICSGVITISIYRRARN